MKIMIVGGDAKPEVITTFHPAVDMASPVVFIEPALVELICRNVPYDDLVGYYEFSDAEINAAGHYVSHGIYVIISHRFASFY